MKVQLLLAIGEHDYAEHISRVLTEKNADVFEISVCSKTESLKELLAKRRFDVALIDESMAAVVDASAVRLPLLLWDGVFQLQGGQKMPRIRKYQRVSAISSEVIQQYAAICGGTEEFSADLANITAVWSPSGGVGKTATAMAYAAKKAAEGKRVVYLDMQPFSATSVYFNEAGTSISVLFEQLNGDVAMLSQGIRREDAGSGIFYFGMPQNYDDLNILTEKDIELLVNGCAANTDELIVDLGSICNHQVQRIFELAGTVLMVSDGTAVCRAKCDQFRTQNNVYADIAHKLVVVANRGARNIAMQGETALSLPLVETEDPVMVYKTLAGYIL